jgi:phenylalanyl-tRNA synthetase beta chain
MKILKSWLQKHIVETLPSDETIEQALILKSSEVEGIEKVIIIDEKGNKVDDTVFDIKVLPDRMHYMLSHRGVAYDLCAVLNLTLKPSNIILSEKATGVRGDVKVNVESDLCNRYSATLITGIDNKPSPQWLKNALESMGARSISSIVDTTNYTMFDTGQPLHAFDVDKVVGGITVRFAREGETLDTLDGSSNPSKQIKLEKHHLVIADDKGPLALAGIKGGKRAEVDQNTKNIILESASFNPISVRKTSFEVGIRNDSSKRYENEITAHLTEKGVSKFIEIIKEISPACKVGNMTDVYKKLPESWTVSVTHKNIESLLNFSIKEDRVIEILKKLQCKVEVKNSGLKNSTYEVIPPFERLDLIIPEDIIDEIGRIEGLDKIKSILPSARNSHENAKGFLVAEKIKDFFVSKGFDEIQTRTFSNKGDIEVAYPMASDKAFLRTTLIENVTESLKLSEKNAPLLGLDKIQIFEIGKTFPKTGEEMDLCFAISYIKKIKNKDAVIKSEIENLVSELEENLKVKLTVTISSNIAYIKHVDLIDTGLDLKSIKIEKGSNKKFIPFSSEPFMVRDIALFVESTETVENVQSVIKESASDVAKELLIKGPDLFDQFEKEGKKSLAFRMIFQASDRTLTDIEVNGFMDKVYEVVKNKGWQVR